MTMIDPDDYILLYVDIVMTMIDPDDYILLYGVSCHDNDRSR